MLEVGWPDPALVLARTESTRSCRATSRAVDRSAMVAVLVTMSPSRR